MFRRTFWGCGWNVITHEPTPFSAADCFTAASILLCPICTPSKFPMVAEVGLPIGSSASNKTFMPES